MAAPRKIIDCRDFPSEKNCTSAISGTEEEVLDLTVLHAVTVHRDQQTADFREHIRSMLRRMARCLVAAAITREKVEILHNMMKEGTWQ